MHCLSLEDISEFYSCLLVSLAFCITLEGWEVRTDEILLSECVIFYLYSGQRHSFL